MTTTETHDMLREFVRRWNDALDEVVTGQEALKLVKAEAKAEGFDLKILGKAITEMRKGPDYQADCLLAEAELDTIRHALGLPTEPEDAQKRALAAAQGQTDLEDAIRDRGGRLDA